MTTIGRRIFSTKFLHKWTTLGSFHEYLPRCNLSTAIQTQEEKINEESKDLIDPLSHPDFFQVHNLFTIKELFDAKVHYGHKEGSFDEHMRQFVFGSRLGHLIIDLNQTAELLREALNFIAHIAFRGGIILFVSRNPQTTHIVETLAKNCEEFAHTRYWKQGTFTNSLHHFGTVTRLPDLCIFLHTLDTVLKPHSAIGEAAKMAIPTIGIVDTNCNPNLITYPVPGNDDSLSATYLYCKLFKEAILRGKEAREKLSKLVEL